MIAYTYSKQRIFIITANWNDSELSNNIIVLSLVVHIHWSDYRQSILKRFYLRSVVGFLWLLPICANTHTLTFQWPSPMQQRIFCLNSMSLIALITFQPLCMYKFVSLRNDYLHCTWIYVPFKEKKGNCLYIQFKSITTSI